jgi:DNA-binding phage protein
MAKTKLQKTKLDAFLREHDITPAELARESGRSRQVLGSALKGTSVPRPDTLSKIVAACRRLSGSDQVTPMDLFELEAQPPKTKLEAFLRNRGIMPSALARETGYSRQHLLRVRQGTEEPTRPCISRIVAACRRLSGDDHVSPTELFELEGEPEVLRRWGRSRR